MRCYSSAPLDLVLIGFGHVARRFTSLVEAERPRLQAQYGIDWRIIAIATRRHGCALAPGGVDPARARELVEAGASVEPLHDRSSGAPPRDALDLIARVAAVATPGHTVVVETTVLDARRGEPAITHIRQALAAGLHVVTANKGPVAFAYRELADAAARAGVLFLFEGTVLDGIPVFNLVRETLPGVRVVGFRGVVNSTTNAILTAMEAGGEFEPALRQMQRAGIAEADPSLDVDGWDAAAKAAALINVLMDGRITPHDIVRTGIAHVTGTDVRQALARGRRLKLVASAARDGDAVTGRVAPEELPLSDPLAGLSGVANALILRTDLLGEIAITQVDGGLTHTAYALLSDLVTIWTRFGGSG